MSTWDSIAVAPRATRRRPVVLVIVAVLTSGCGSPVSPSAGPQAPPASVELLQPPTPEVPGPVAPRPGPDVPVAEPATPARPDPPWCVRDPVLAGLRPTEHPARPEDRIPALDAMFRNIRETWAPALPPVMDCPAVRADLDGDGREDLAVLVVDEHTRTTRLVLWRERRPLRTLVRWPAAHLDAEGISWATLGLKPAGGKVQREYPPDHEPDPQRPALELCGSTAGLFGVPGPEDDLCYCSVFLQLVHGEVRDAVYCD